MKTKISSNSGGAVGDGIIILACAALVALVGGSGIAFMLGVAKDRNVDGAIAKADTASPPAAVAAPAPGAVPPAGIPAAAGSASPAEPPAGDSAEIAMGVVPLVLKYDKPAFTVKTGQKVKITFTNNDVQPHNMLIVKPGKIDAVGALANAMMTDPQGMAKGYLPESDDILWHVKLLQPQQADSMEFTAPEPAEYPYLCTFPGHWLLMRGVMTVVE